MNNLNSVIIEGNLVRDPICKTTAKGTAITSFPIATNRYFKQGENMEKETSFFDVETWSKLAETCEQLGHKGRGVRVIGRLKQDRWNDGEGKARSRVTIVAQHIEFRPEMKREEQSGEAVKEERFAASF
ncbi:single-stranded DNA-binding protein [Spirochaetia bacterium]|nr:single-stranded DNA-binding protein [Spirochaetia bacterium]